MKIFLILFALAAMSLQAATITIASDLLNESNNITGTNVYIQPNSIWATAPAGAGWISYANTGAGPGSFSPPDNILEPTAIFTQNFFLPNADNSGSIQVWADDTASVSLDGSPVGPPADFTDGSNCANAAIGCIQDNFGTISLTGLGEGEHALTFDVYQTGGGPFGLLYDGSVNSVPSDTQSSTPEPGTFVLLGGGLLALSALRWRRSPRRLC